MDTKGNEDKEGTFLTSYHVRDYLLLELKFSSQTHGYKICLTKSMVLEFCFFFKVILKKSRIYLAVSSLSCNVWASIWLCCRGLSGCGVQTQLPQDKWDLSSPNKDRTRVPHIGRWILNHWITREVLGVLFDASNLKSIRACRPLFMRSPWVFQTFTTTSKERCTC